MTERGKLLAYLLALLTASWLISPAWLSAGLGAVLMLCGLDAARLARRALLATAAFSGMVSLAYAGYAWWQFHTLPLDWLLTVNLRVLLMALLTFLFIERVNLFQALSFSRRLSFLLVLAVSQSLGLHRTLAEFRLGLQSRSPRPAGLAARYRAAAHAAAWLLDRALANAHESAQAMQARGMFR
jgi:cobalt/nickel transport system permease protein